MKKQIYILFIFLLSFTWQTFAQGFAGIKIRTFDILIINNINSHIFTMNIDSKGHILMSPGLSLSYSHFIYENKAALKITEEVYIDPASQASGYTSIGLMFRLAKKTNISKRAKNILNLSAGPALYYRSSWESIKGYIPETIVKKKGNMQYFLWFHAGAEYAYSFSKWSDFTVSLNYGYPNALYFEIGFNIWVSKKFKFDCGC
ncbi:MAG: hypothetical protein HY738_18595 [Bacteroidia bacterium]|nr:hypothetical protein [Bacteroidia bacterium]